MQAHLSPELIMDLPNLATHECGPACEDWQGHVDIAYINDPDFEPTSEHLDTLWWTWHTEMLDAFPTIGMHGFEPTKEAPAREGWTSFLVVYWVHRDWLANTGRGATEEAS